MDDNLIGYLLNALDPDEHRRTEEYLRGNAEARRKLELLRSALAPLAADAGQPDSPAGLVERTLARWVRQSPLRRLTASALHDEPSYSPSRWPGPRR